MKEQSQEVPTRLFKEMMNYVKENLEPKVKFTGNLDSMRKEADSIRDSSIIMINLILTNIINNNYTISED